MPTLYTENSEKWKSLADVDYFTQFVKAWIPFNAWYKNYFPELDSDRKAIDEIESKSNKFRDKLSSLINGSDNESSLFKTHVAKLHYELGRKYIWNKYGERLSFDAIVIEWNSQKIETFSRSNMTYRVERGPRGTKENNIEISITSTTGVKFTYLQINGYDFEDVKRCPDFIRLSQAQQKSIEECYKNVNPRKPINLLTADPNDYIEMGNFKFVHDPDLLCKAIIEILYNLRNALFHGEIVPDRDTLRVYEPAYHLLNALVQAL